MSRPKSLATTSRRSISATVQRSVVCAVACSPALRIRPIRPETRRGARVSSSASTPTATSESSPTNLLFAPRKMATATIGRNSPTAPAAIMKRPKRPPSMSLSRRIGSSVPRAVVVSADRHRHERPHQPGELQQPDDGAGQHDGDQPAHDREAAGPLPEQAQVQLVAGQQEQEAEPHVREQLDAVRLGPAEHLRADHDAADDQDDDLGDAQAGQQADDEGGERRHQHDDPQAVQPLGEIVHGRHPSPRRSERRAAARTTSTAVASTRSTRAEQRCSRPGRRSGGAAPASVSYAASSRRATWGEDAP